MAWVRCCGGTSKKKDVIYKEGVFNVGMDNPGSYRWTTNALSVGASLQSNKFITINTTGITYCLIGTSSKFDFTNYNVLKVRAKGINGNSAIVLCSDKNLVWDSRITFGNISSNVEHTISIDISAVTEAYIAFEGSPSDSAEYYEVWCE